MKDHINPLTSYRPAYDRSIHKRGRKASCLFLLCILLFPLLPAHAQQSSHAIHANIVYHFTKYINWPDHKKSGDFVIGIVGDSPLYHELKAFIENKTVGAQRIIVKKFSAKATVFPTHILFIGEDESKSLKR